MKALPVLDLKYLILLFSFKMNTINKSWLHIAQRGWKSSDFVF